MLPTLSYTFGDPAGHGYSFPFGVLGFFVIATGIAWLLFRTRNEKHQLGGISLFVTSAFWFIVFVGIYYYQGGSHRFHTLDAYASQIRLQFSDPQEILVFAKSEIASLTFGIETPNRSNQSWCYLQLTTASGKRYTSQKRSGDDCKLYRHEIARLMNLSP
jgi:hypothetical protein